MQVIVLHTCTHVGPQFVISPEGFKVVLLISRSSFSKISTKCCSDVIKMIFVINDVFVDDAVGRT